jgi:hypothetical protein
MMTVRECHRRIALFQKADYIPNYEDGYSPRTIREWWKEGLPAGMQPGEFFGFDKKEMVRDISLDPVPGFTGQYKSLDQYRPMLEPLGYDVGFDDKHCMVARKDGREFYILHNAWDSIRLLLKSIGPDDDEAEGGYVQIRHTLENPADWVKFRSQFKPDLAARYGDERPGRRWADRVAAWKGHQHFLTLEAPSLGGIAHEMGFENFCMKLCDHRSMIEEWMDARTDLAIQILDRAVSEVEFDDLWFWEDIAFRNGPYLSPQWFEELAVPRYRKLIDWFRKRGGQIVSVDSDGDARLLIPGWLRAGVNHIWPLEVFAGMDVVALRKQYGQAFSMRGGINKFVIAKGTEAIDRELDRIHPVVQDGGYIPHLDHQISGARFEDYCYYMEKKMRMIGKRAK